MISEGSTFWMTYKRFRPHILMVFVQIASAFMYFITEAAFNRGMNPHVYVTYRHLLGGLVVLPFAYFQERKIRPKLTISLCIEIFVYSLLGVGLTINLSFASLKYTSPTFVSATTNSIPTLTFILAVLFRMEALNIRKPQGLAKATGTLVSLAGTLTITLYRGPAISSLWKSLIHLEKQDYKNNWIEGPILAIASCITWSIWFTMQGFTLNRYPAQLSLATLANLIGAAQSAIFTLVALRHQPASWHLRSFMDIATVLFGGVVTSAINFKVILLCAKERGPVFVTMFCPLQTILVVISSYFILGENLYTGSIIGAVAIIVGLYLLLWGKRDQDNRIAPQKQSPTSSIEQNDPNSQTVTVLDTDILKN